MNHRTRELKEKQIFNIEDTKYPVIKMTPAQWNDLLGTKIIDADGWRNSDIHEEQINFDEFYAKARRCTVGNAKFFDNVERAINKKE